MPLQESRSFVTAPLRKAAIFFQTPGAHTIRRLSWIFLLVTLPAVLFYAYLGYSETGAVPRPGRNAIGYIASIVIGSIIGLSLYWLNRVLDKRIPWMDHFTSRFLVGFITNVAAALTLLSVLTVLATSIAGANIFWPSGAAKDLDVKWKIVILASLFIFIYKVIYTLLYAYQHYAVAQLSQLSRERKQLELQFEALKRQISPHFLFNNLNTISSLLMKDRATAEQFIRRLALTYQYVLATQDKKFVALGEELDFVESYYYLLRMRFQQQLHVEVNVPAKIMETRIPPLTLQMLVENAVKHNAFADDEKLIIYISVQDNTWLKVINTKTGSHDNVTSFNLGLENIRQRYKYLTEKPVRVENLEKFIVSLPIIPMGEETREKKHSA